MWVKKLQSQSCGFVIFLLHRIAELCLTASTQLEHARTHARTHTHTHTHTHARTHARTLTHSLTHSLTLTHKNFMTKR